MIKRLRSERIKSKNMYQDFSRDRLIDRDDNRY